MNLQIAQISQIQERSSLCVTGEMRGHLSFSVSLYLYG